jgi:hypothetical protein
MEGVGGSTLEEQFTELLGRLRFDDEVHAATTPIDALRIP